MMRLSTLVLIAFIITPAAIFAQDSFLKRQYIADGDTLPYRILLPMNYDATKSYPVVLFLHGAGERGTDNEKQLVHGSKLFLESANRKKYPAIVIFPQCAPDSYWSNVDIKTDTSGKRSFHFTLKDEPTRMMAILMAFVKQLPSQYRITENRFYVAGLSMGGMGTFEIARRMPARFAAAMPICGGADPGSAPVLKNIKWWVFHGTKDNVVPIEHSEKMVAALKAAKASVKYTVYPEAMHNSWDNAFAEPNFLSWLFAQRKKS
jgi:predicted peptidase